MESSRRHRITAGAVSLAALLAAVTATVALRRGPAPGSRGAGAPVPNATAPEPAAVLASAVGALAPSTAIREPEVAGKFYPDDSAALTAAVDDALARATDFHLEKLRALVVPHAGYPFSGLVAGFGFRQLRGRAFRTVYVMAPSHHAAFTGVSVGKFSAYRTPLGLLRVSPLSRVLPGVAPFTWVPESERDEHSLEVELPFLTRLLPEAALVPLLFGATDPVAVAQALLPRLDADSLVVASSDLSHFHPYDEAVALDRATLDGIVALDPGRVGDESACGRLPILTVIALARQLGWNARLLDYRNSGDTAGERSRVVGYGAVAFVAGK